MELMQVGFCVPCGSLCCRGHPSPACNSPHCNLQLDVSLCNADATMCSRINILSLSLLTAMSVLLLSISVVLRARLPRLCAEDSSGGSEEETDSQPLSGEVSQGDVQPELMPQADDLPSMLQIIK